MEVVFNMFEVSDVGSAFAFGLLLLLLLLSSSSSSSLLMLIRLFSLLATAVMPLI
jgi:hypothetical protein